MDSSTNWVKIIWYVSAIANGCKPRFVGVLSKFCNRRGLGCRFPADLGRLRLNVPSTLLGFVERRFGILASRLHKVPPRGNLRPGVINLDHSRALPAAVVSLGFALLARGLRGVSDGGALAGAVIAFLLMWAAGLEAILPLVAVFLLTLVTTRWRSDRKRNLGVAERRSGRTASQVVANLGAAGICAAAAAIFPHAYPEWGSGRARPPWVPVCWHRWSLTLCMLRH